MPFEYLMFGIVVGSLISWGRAHGKAEYWRGKCEEQCDSGWAEEARFWRRTLDKDAAQAVEPTD